VKRREKKKSLDGKPPESPQKDPKERPKKGEKPRKEKKLVMQKKGTNVRKRSVFIKTSH